MKINRVAAAMKINRIATAVCLVSALGLTAMIWSRFSLAHFWITIVMAALFLLSAFHVVPSKKLQLTSHEIADLIDRFLNNGSLYPQEWNDFVEHSQWDKELDKFRKRCDELNALVNSHVPPDQNAITELRAMVEVLRKSGSPSRSA
jgi:hypothetical protein